MHGTSVSQLSMTHRKNYILPAYTSSSNDRAVPSASTGNPNTVKDPGSENNYVKVTVVEQRTIKQHLVQKIFESFSVKRYVPSPRKHLIKD